MFFPWTDSSTLPAPDFKSRLAPFFRPFSPLAVPEEKSFPIPRNLRMMIFKPAFPAAWDSPKHRDVAFRPGNMLFLALPKFKK